MVLHPQIRDEILKALRAGMNIKRAADFVGYKAEEIGREMQDDPLFAAEVRQATAQPEFAMLAKLQESGQWQAWKFLLQSMYPGRYYASRKLKRRPPAQTTETNEQRLARLNIPEQIAMRPLLAKMDGKQPVPETDSDKRGERQVAGGEDSA
jgi:hypothetical protein